MSSQSKAIIGFEHPDHHGQEPVMIKAQNELAA